jgi:exosortase
MSVAVNLRTISIKHLWRVFAVVAALLFAYATVLGKLGRDWWTDENYSHGLLVPLIIAFVLWSQRERLARASQRAATWSGLTAVLLALVALWAGTAGAELYLQRTSLVLILAGTVLYFWGFNLLRLLIVPLFLLLLAIPIPAIIFNKIAFPLQLFASRCAVWAMTFFDIPVLRQGNVIELMPLGARETKKLEVVEACSGIRSLMTLVTLAVVFAYFTHPRDDEDQNPCDDGQNHLRKRVAKDESPTTLEKREPPANAGGSDMMRRLHDYGFWRSTIIVVSAVPIAIFTNALRVSGTGVLARYYGTKVADGFFHSFSGWVIYVVAFLMLFGVGWILDRVNPAKPAARKAAVKLPATVKLAAAEGAES